MRPINKTYTPAADSTTGFKTGATAAGPFTMTTTSPGDGPAQPVSWRTNPFELVLDFDLCCTVNYTVQHCFENVLDPNLTPSTFTWFDHETLTTQTTDQDGNYDFAIMAIRIKFNSLTAGGSLKAMVLQGTN